MVHCQFLEPRITVTQSAEVEGIMYELFKCVIQTFRWPCQGDVKRVCEALQGTLKVIGNPNGNTVEYCVRGILDVIACV